MSYVASFPSIFLREPQASHGGENWLLMLASPGDSEGDCQSTCLRVLSFSRLRRSRQLLVSRVCCDGCRRGSCEGAGDSAREGDTRDKSRVLLFTNACQECHCPRADTSHIASSLSAIPHPEGEEVCSLLGHYVFIRQLQNFLSPGFLQRPGHLTACPVGSGFRLTTLYLTQRQLSLREF